MSHLGHSSHSAASDGSVSALNLSGSLLLQDFCKLSWSIFNGPLLLFQPEATFFILCQEVRLHSSFVEDEDGDLISPVQMSVEFTTSFP